MKKNEAKEWEERGGVILMKGPVPVTLFAKAAKRLPKDAVMDVHVARLAGVGFAMGKKEDLLVLAEELKPEARERTRLEFAGRGLPDSAIEWVAVGERGASSEVLFGVLSGVALRKDEGVEHPWDADDFSRCRKMLEAIPEFVFDKEKVSKISKEWASLVEKWDNICLMMDEESPDWRAGKGSAKKTNEIISSALSRPQRVRRM